MLVSKNVLFGRIMYHYDHHNKTMHLPLQIALQCSFGFPWILVFQYTPLPPSEQKHFGGRSGLLTTVFHTNPGNSSCSRDNAFLHSSLLSNSTNRLSEHISFCFVTRYVGIAVNISKVDLHSRQVPQVLPCNNFHTKTSIYILPLVVDSVSVVVILVVVGLVVVAVVV